MDWKKWKCSDSYDSDSVELMTPLTTLIFNFHLVIRELMTTTQTLTPSLVKTSLSPGVSQGVLTYGVTLGGGGGKAASLA